MLFRSDTARYDFGTPEWSAAYAKQVNLLLDQLATANARIFWVAPPPMRDPDYDAAMKTIAALQKAEFEEKLAILTGAPLPDRRQRAADDE